MSVGRRGRLTHPEYMTTYELLESVRRGDASITEVADDLFRREREKKDEWRRMRNNAFLAGGIIATALHCLLVRIAGWP